MSEERPEYVTFGLRTTVEIRAKLGLIVEEHERETGERLSANRLIERVLTDFIAELEAERGKPYVVPDRKAGSGSSPLADLLSKRESARAKKPARKRKS